MSNEATVRSSLTIRKGKVLYNSLPFAFTADIATASAGTPGEVTATVLGITISLAQLAALGGFCRIQNLDETNFVTVGIYNGATFFPLDELLPGESYIKRLSRYLQHGLTGTAHLYDLRIVAHTASCKVLIEAFEP